MEQTLTDFFAAINRNDVDGALACCDDDIQCLYPDPGRNWQGKDRGRTVMIAIFGQLQAFGKTASFEIAESVDEEDQRTIHTKEDWGHPKMVIKTTYTFTKDNKILKMQS